MASEPLSSPGVEPVGATDDVLSSGRGTDAFPVGTGDDDLLDPVVAAEPLPAGADGATDVFWSAGGSDDSPGGPCCADDVIGRPRRPAVAAIRGEARSVPLPELTSDARNPRGRRTP